MMTRRDNVRSHDTIDDHDAAHVYAMMRVYGCSIGEAEDMIRTNDPRALSVVLIRADYGMAEAEAEER